ncbi:MAG: hypothetical protein R6U70_05000 [Bacillota bacterium]
MRSTLIMLIVATLALTVVAYITGGSSLVLEGLARSLHTAGQALPLIVAAFLVVGPLGIYLTPERVESMLRRYDGVRGLLMTALAGGLLPGGPYVFYPLASSALARWRVPEHLLFSFVSGKHAWDLSRLPLEISLVGLNLAVIRNVLTLPYPLVGAIIFRFTGGGTPVAEERDDS